MNEKTDYETINIYGNTDRKIKIGDTVATPASDAEIITKTADGYIFTDTGAWWPISTVVFIE